MVSEVSSLACGDLGGEFLGFGTSCSEVKCEALCGLPGSGDCCDDNGTPACDDADCCNAVCGTDPFCCGVGWDVKRLRTIPVFLN